MKKFAFVTLALVALLIVPALSAQGVQNEIAYTRAQIQADRQTIVTAAMKLPDAKAEAFWPVYRAYRAEVDKLGDRTWKLLLDFADKYETLSDEDSAKLLKEWLAIEQQYATLKVDWAPKFSKVIGATSTARFFQIESKLDSIVRLEATTSVPLAGGPVK